MYGVVAYLAVYFVIRFMGKRTLAEMNVFDLLATVALGSTIATFVVDDGIGFTGGAVAMALPLALQWGVAWMSSRSRRVERFIKQHPAMLVWDGVFLEEMMRHEMITQDDVREAVRKAGLTSLHDAKAVVLEVDGTISVMRADENKHTPPDDDPASAFTHVKREPKGDSEV